MKTIFGNLLVLPLIVVWSGAGLVGAAAFAAEGSVASSDLAPHVVGAAMDGPLNLLTVRPIDFQSDIEVAESPALIGSGFQLNISDSPPWAERRGTDAPGFGCAVCASSDEGWLTPFAQSTALGVNYAGALSGVALTLGGSYFAADVDRSALSAEPPKAWGVGGRLGFSLGEAGALSFGGSYSARNYLNLSGGKGPLATIVSGSTNASSWDAGLRYSYGAWMLGGFYQSAQADTASAIARSLASGSLQPGLGGRAVALEGGYRIAPGFALAASVQLWSYNNGPVAGFASDGASRSGPATVVFLETSLDF